MDRDQLFKDAREKFAGVLTALVALFVFLQGVFPDILGDVQLDMELLQAGVDFVAVVVVALFTVTGLEKAAKAFADKEK